MDKEIVVAAWRGKEANLVALAHEAPDIVRGLYAARGIEVCTTVGGYFGRGGTKIEGDPHRPDIDVDVTGKKEQLERARQIFLEIQQETDVLLRQRSGIDPTPPVHIRFAYGDWPAEGDYWG